MDRARFRRMKRRAFFINIGWGRATRLDDLVAALRAGELAGAGLDVFDERRSSSEAARAPSTGAGVAASRGRQE